MEITSLLCSFSIFLSAPSDEGGRKAWVRARTRVSEGEGDGESEGSRVGTLAMFCWHWRTTTKPLLGFCQRDIALRSIEKASRRRTNPPCKRFLFPSIIETSLTSNYFSCSSSLHSGDCYRVQAWISENPVEDYAIFTWQIVYFRARIASELWQESCSRGSYTKKLLENLLTCGIWSLFLHRNQVYFCE